MLTNQKGDESEEKYDEWYSLLEKELGLLAKPDAKIISIGTKVDRFHSERRPYGHVGTVPRYFGRTARYWGKEITNEKRKYEYREFAAGIQAVSGSSCSPNHIWGRDCELGEATPTELQMRRSHSETPAVSASRKPNAGCRGAGRAVRSGAGGPGSWRISTDYI